jgi:hypothetical protein
MVKKRIKKKGGKNTTHKKPDPFFIFFLIVECFWCVCVSVWTVVVFPSFRSFGRLTRKTAARTTNQSTTTKFLTNTQKTTRNAQEFLTCGDRGKWGFYFRLSPFFKFFLFFLF